MTVIGTPESTAGSGTSSTTYADVIGEARQMLRDEEGTFNWSDAVMLVIANDGVELIRKVLMSHAPDMFIVSASLSIIADNAGPYSLPDGLVYPQSILNSRNQPIDKTNREAELQYVASRSGEPQKYWLEGWGPLSIYFDRTPKQAYTFTVKYVPKFTRATANTENIPIPDDCRSALRAWIERIAGMIDEYNTMDEKAKLDMLMPLLTTDAVKRANTIDFTVSGVEF